MKDLRALAVEYAGLIVALAALVGIFSFSAPHFLSGETFATISNQVPSAVIAAAGMTFVLGVAEIDLSVGSVLGFASAVLGTLMARQLLGLAGSLAACLATGAVCGALSATIITRWRIPSFIVTLGMLEVARGCAHLVTGSQTQYVGSAVGALADTRLLGLSLPFLLAILVVVSGQTMLSRMAFGRHLLAVGANPEAARLSGVDPGRVKRIVFVLSGLLAAVGGAIDTSRFQAADPNAGMGFELEVIAAVVIGGTSLMGGRASVIGSFLGVLIIAVLGAGLAALGVRDETKRLVTGCVIVGAVILDQYRRR